MKIYYKILFLFVALVCLSSCANQSKDYVYYEDLKINKDILSEDTIKWLEFYNDLSENEKLTVSYIPPEIINILNQSKDIEDIIPDNSSEVIDKIIGKVLRVDTIENKVLICSNIDKLFWCSYDNIEKLKDGYYIEVVNNKVLNTEENVISVSSESITIIYSNYSDKITNYLDGIKEIWEENKEYNTDEIILKIDDISNITNIEKVGLKYLLSLDLDINILEDNSEISDKMIINVENFMLNEEVEDNYLYSFKVSKILNENKIEFYYNVFNVMGESVIKR